MTRLLTSVRNAAEARRALAGGAHLIDVKEPAAGPLGAASTAVIVDVLRAVDGRAPVSVALGELVDDDRLARASGLPACAYAKFGMSGLRRRDDWRQRWREALERLPAGTTPVAVAYADAEAADAPDPDEILEIGARLGCGALLVDTWDKSHGSLLDHLDPVRLSALAAAARAAGLLFVAAGSLARSHLAVVARAAPDFLGVRGAVCTGGREGELDEALVRRFAADLAVLPIERPLADWLASPVV